MKSSALYFPEKPDPCACPQCHSSRTRAVAIANRPDARGSGWQRSGMRAGSGGLGFGAGHGTGIYSNRIAEALQGRRSLFSHASAWVGLALVALFFSTTSASIAFVALVVLDIAMFMRAPDLSRHSICLRCGHTWAPGAARHGAPARRTVAH